MLVHGHERVPSDDMPSLLCGGGGIKEVTLALLNVCHILLSHQAFFLITNLSL